MSTDVIIANRFKITSKVGSGSFGEIYRGIDLERAEEVAIKLELSNATHPQVIYEAKIMRHIAAEGIPIIYWYGTEGEYNIMVMELLGPSLEDLLSYCGRKLTLKTALMIADQLITLIEYVHLKHFIHRDIKPDNFLIGLGGKSSIIHIIDFGLAKRYRDPKTLLHIPYKNNKSLTGTARYASVNTHMGIEQSRRDDLECICYVLLYLLKGSLPWQGLTARNKAEKYKKIMESKIAISAETLCKGLPQELQTMIKYCKGLKFEEDPNYQILKNQLKEMFLREKYEYDLNFDWENHAADIERKSTFHHLTQHQMIRRKAHDEAKDEARFFFLRENKNRKDVNTRKNSMIYTKTPRQEQSSLAVYVSTCYQPDASPARHNSLIQTKGDATRKYDFKAHNNSRNSGVATDVHPVVVPVKKKRCCNVL